jgi:hypothetical protein
MYPGGKGCGVRLAFEAVADKRFAVFSVDEEIERADAASRAAGAQGHPQPQDRVQVCAGSSSSTR